MAGLKLLLALVTISVATGGKWVGAQVHHVVGDDRGWDPSSDVASWSSARVFRPGDKIWFAYSAAQENVVELRSSEEFESCDVSNPIRMYTDGLDSVSLDGEGIRYFASGKSESCRNGLRLRVEVQPQSNNVIQIQIRPDAKSCGSAKATATGPAAPYSSTRVNGLSFVLFVGLLLCHLGL